MSNRIHWLLAVCALLLFTLTARADEPATGDYVLGVR